MTVIHIVLFRWTASSDAATIRQVCHEMLDLRNQCLHPTSKQQYIVTSTGGIDNSPEGAQGGFTHGFVVEFENVADRDYYISGDPAHQAFVEKNKRYLEDVRVIDYEKGVF